MRKIIAFYAWQNDTPQKFNRDLIDIALRDAAKRISDDPSLDLELCIDSDTQDVPGNPPVTETILKKIVDCDIFIPDVTFVARTEGGKPIPNPNVMTEFGYALRAKTHAATMSIMNTFFGPPEELPFDMGHLRHPIQYSADPTAKDSQRREIRDAVSKKIEEKLRLQIAHTEPRPLVSMAFLKVAPKDGPARFRAPDEPIGKRWNDIPFVKLPEQDVYLSAGPAMWLRLIPKSAPGKRWPASELKKCAYRSGQLDLAPFMLSDHQFHLRAEDGIAMCLLRSSEDDETSSVAVAFAFETGEIWSIDTTLLRYHADVLPVGEMEEIYSQRLLGYSRFLTNLGLAPPYEWVAGITDIKGRRLLIPDQPERARMPTFSGPECLAEKIVIDGVYDGQQSPLPSLISFFNEIFHKCGVERSTYNL
jgi:hypothetical protein